MNPGMYGSVHSGRLERFLGRDEVEHLSRRMRGWFGPPIAVGGVPGLVWATGDGDFIGRIDGGSHAGVWDMAADHLARYRRSREGRLLRPLGGGIAPLELDPNVPRDRRLMAFSNLSAVIAAQTGGKGQDFTFQKAGAAVAAAGNCCDLWSAGNQPSAGAAGAAAPGGTSPTNSTTGAFKFTNPANSNTAHFVSGWALTSTASNALLLYDRLFSVAKTMNSTATEAVTGTFSRYQSGTATNEDYIGGNFCFPSNPTTILAGTAHNWTVCQYTNQASTTGQSFPSIAGLSACAVRSIDLAAQNWFMPLAAGDVGVKALTQMQCSALVATGTIDFVVGHPIAMLPCPVAQVPLIVDGVNSAFNLTRIYDNAALAFLELPKPSGTAATYNGMFKVVAE